MLLPSQASVHTHGGIPCRNSRTSEFVYYMAHIENAANIIKWGLFAHKWASRLPHRRDIADNDVMGNREEFWSFVNLYFGTHTAMQWVLNIEEEDLVFIRFPSDEIIRGHGVKFSDGNVASYYTTVYDASSESEELSSLDWPVIMCMKNFHGDSAKRKKMSEMLVPNYVPPSMIHSAVVLNQRAEERLRELIQSEAPPGYTEVTTNIFAEMSRSGIKHSFPNETSFSTQEGPFEIISPKYGKCKIIRDRKREHFFSHGDGVEPRIQHSKVDISHLLDF